MFVKKDTRYIKEILQDDKDERKELRLGRRPHEFNHNVTILCDRMNLPSLSNLTTLSLYDNDLLDLKYIGLLRETPIRNLNLGHNSLKELPHEIGLLETLESIWLEDNQFEIFPESLFQLKNLKTLRLSNNSIDRLPSRIKHLNQLKELMVDNNRLTYLPSELGKLIQLEIFNARGNQIQQIPHEIGSLIMLKVICLSKNKIQNFPESLSLCKNLTHIYFNGNQIQKIPNDLVLLKHLKKLNLSHNQIISFLPHDLIHDWHLILTHEQLKNEGKLTKKPQIILFENPFLHFNAQEYDLNEVLKEEKNQKKDNLMVDKIMEMEKEIIP